MPSRKKVEAAQELRRRATDSEALLWERLRGRRFFGLKFRRQHPVGPYVLDFYCPALRLGIEIDGAAHDSGVARGYDADRDAILDAAGIRVERVSAAAVERDADAVVAELGRCWGLE